MKTEHKFQIQMKSCLTHQLQLLFNAPRQVDRTLVNLFQSHKVATVKALEEKKFQIDLIWFGFGECVREWIVLDIMLHLLYKLISEWDSERDIFMLELDEKIFHWFTM